MSAVTRILSQIEQGNWRAADELLPLVYEELRKLAAVKLAGERPGQTLQATALVHEAYVRLVGKGNEVQWQGRGHFFAAAAEAMRRILVERYRRKQATRHGGNRQQVPLDEAELAVPALDYDLVAVDDALNRLPVGHPPAAHILYLQVFVGLPR